MATVEVSVAASADDIRVRYSDATGWARSLTDTEQPVGFTATSDYKLGGGMRFLNVAIPNGATITAAYITLVARNSDANNTVNAVLVGEKTNAPATFSDIANYQARRGTIAGGADDTQITTASVAWNGIGSITGGSSYNTPDISTIIQEIVNLVGWVGDGTDDIVVFLDDHAGTSTASSATYRRFSSWDHATYAAPLLHIEYTSGTTYEMELTDGLKGGDTVGTAASFQMAVTDGLTGGDSNTSQAVLGMALTDGLSGGDSIAPQVSLQSIFTDGLTLSDAVTLSQIYEMLVSDGATVGDSAQMQAVIQMLVSDGLTLADATIIAKALVILATVSLNSRSLTLALKSRSLTVALPNRSLTVKLPNRSLTVALPERSLTLKMKGVQ